MSFDKKKFLDIYKAMETEVKERLPEATDFQEGSVLRSLFESFAVELGVLYQQMDRVYNSAFIDTAAGVDLDRVVALLGIKRNEPDYATGIVTFEREQALNEEVVIPAGTIITTEEDTKEENPRKVYITIEEKIINKQETSVDVRIKAQIKGKEMKTGADTVIVMPRPVPGVKLVANKKPVRFLGKDGETDEELRSRAKQMLLASGRANITSIENCLFTMPGIRDVRVNELFDLYKVTDDTIVRFEKFLFSKKEQSDAEIAAIVAILNEIRKDTGPLIEEEFLDYVKSKLLDMVNTKYYKELLDYSRFVNPGIIEVYVDGLTDANYREVKQRLDEVRAAGIYIRLKPALPVNLIAHFDIDITEGITGDDMDQLEKDVRDIVFNFVDSLKLGDPLIFSQLTGKILNVKGVTDLVDFTIKGYRELEQFAVGKITVSRTITTSNTTLEAPVSFSTNLDLEYRCLENIVFKKDQKTAEVVVYALKSGKPGELHRTGIGVEWNPLSFDGDTFTAVNDEPILLPSTLYQPIDKRIEVKILERIVPEKIIVAAGIKDRLVRVQVKLESVAAAIKNDVNKLKKKAGEIAEKVTEFFTMHEKESFTEIDIKNVVEKLTQISSVGITLFEKPFQEELYNDVFTIKPSIVEKAVPETIFVYKDRLELAGQITLVFSLTASDDEKEKGAAGVKQAINDYLESLQPEEDITFEEVYKIAEGGEGVLRVELDPGMFTVTCPAVPANDYADRIDLKAGKVKIKPLEKLYLSKDGFVIKT